MTIRVYPSCLPGEPLEVHEHRPMTLHQWLTENVREYKQDVVAPITVEIDGKYIPSTEWALCHISPSMIVNIRPVPYGGFISGALQIVTKPLQFVFNLLGFKMAGDVGGFGSTPSGTSLDLSGAKANTAKLGDPIREPLGLSRIYPDYALQPVSRFDPDNPQIYRSYLFLVIGDGDFAIDQSLIKIGNTPVSAFGADISYTIYPPGAYVGGDPRSENWCSAPEVGSTSSGTSGLDLASTGPSSVSITAEAITVAGNNLTVISSSAQAIPASWQVGTVITVVAPDTYDVTTVSGENVIYGDFTELNPYVGMPVSLTFNSQRFDLFVSSYSPGSPSIVSSITLAIGSASGTEFVGIPNGQQRIALGLTGYQYRITEISGYTLTLERLIQGAGGSVSVDTSWPGFTARTLLDAVVTGINENDSWVGPFFSCPANEKTSEIELNFVYPQGLCEVGGGGEILAHAVSISVQYRMVGSTTWTNVLITHLNATVNEIGYTQRIVLPTLATYEVRVKRDTPVWGGSTRDIVHWQSMRAKLPARPTSYQGVTTIALTVRTGNRLAAQSDRRINLVATRIYDDYAPRSISGALFYVLKSLGFSDSQIDYATINALQDNYWTPRGETFDYSAEKSGMSGLEVLQKITNAGMGYFLLSDGLASAGREGIKNWTGIISPQEQTEDLQTGFTSHSQDDFEGVDVTYINGTTWAEETVQCRTPDNPNPSKVESYTLDGVLDEDRAYRIGMRRLMGYKYQRLTHSTSTELDALCYEFMDRIIMTDDIPGNNTISCLVIDMTYDTTTIRLEVSEQLDWSFPNPRVLIRYQDGTASSLLVPTMVDGYTLTIPYSSEIAPETWVMDDGSVEPPRLIFCSSVNVGYDTLIAEISPSNDGTCQVSAIQYTPLKYQYDDATYPGNVM